MVWLGEEVGKSQHPSCCISQTSPPQEVRLTPHRFHDFISDCFSGCDCESDFTDGTCEDLTGRCYCRPNFTGEHCAACAKGYTDFPHCYREDQLGARVGVNGKAQG